MLQRDLGKQKAQRIDVLHYRQRTWLTWMRWLAAGCGLILTAIYVGWVIWLDQPSPQPSLARSLQLSTGPLAQVHASFENNCQKCHADDFGIGLSPDSIQLDADARLNLQSKKCGDCHNQALAPTQWHFRDKLAHPEIDKDCARCHQDHQGRGFAMSQVSDAACSQCHQNLSSACRGGIKSELNNSVSDFSAASHGQVFRSLAADTGRIKFNHAEHMQPGQVPVGHKGAFQKDWLPKGRGQYESITRDGVQLVQLDCKDCHEPLKINDASRPNGAAREEGRFYAPVSFDKHCAACHQMTYAGQTSDDLSLPHYADAAQLSKLLSLNSRLDRLKGQVSMRADRVLSDEERKSLPTANQPIDLNDTIISQAVESVFNRCQQCHLKEDVSADKGSALSLALEGQPQSLIPTRWLQFGFFDHAAHAKINNCEYCHPGTRQRDEATTQKIEQFRAANPGSLTNAVDQHLVKINSISSCLPCHRASDLPDDASLNTAAKRQAVLGEAHQPIRASNACTLCHRYHWTRPAAQVSP